QPVSKENFLRAKRPEFAIHNCVYSRTVRCFYQSRFSKGDCTQNLTCRSFWSGNRGISSSWNNWRLDFWWRNEASTAGDRLRKSKDMQWQGFSGQGNHGISSGGSRE